MKKSEWDDREIEELLSQMPKIRDERDSREIYQNIMVKMNKRKQRSWFMPAGAAVAAALLFLILAPNLMNWQQFSEEKSIENADMEASTKLFMEENTELQEDAEYSTLNESATEDHANREAEGNPEMGLTMIQNEDPSTAVYEEDLSEMEVLTYAIPDKNVMFSVPVSVLVPKETQKSKFELFDENMANLTEEEWGLQDYFPLNADLSYDEEKETLSVDVPADHKYGDGSASELIFSHALSYTMETLNIDQLKFTTDGEPGIMLSHTGFLEELEKDRSNHAYYLFYPNDMFTKPYIVPYGEEHQSIIEAFNAMREDRKEAKLLASIPAELHFETEENKADKKLTIRFKEGTKINDDASTLHTIEAILLTAKDFDYQAVKLENANIDTVGKFELDEEIQVPVAANKRSLPQ